MVQVGNEISFACQRPVQRPLHTHRKVPIGREGTHRKGRYRLPDNVKVASEGYQ